MKYHHDELSNDGGFFFVVPHFVAEAPVDFR